MDTIFALSSGSPPAGIGVIRITGPRAREAVSSIAGKVPQPRLAMRARFRDGAGELLDDGLALFFPGPNSATGEDLAELHCHGGRAVIAAVEQALAAIDGLRCAEPGEFTRRAFANGRMDLAEAEGLADLLSAETEIQRRSALAMAGGALSRKVEDWRERLLRLSAQVEAVLDFDDEDDVEALPQSFGQHVEELANELGAAMDAPSAETLREGYRVALAGPPNAGKSTLFNALTDSDAAITADVPGTTRDVLTASVSIGGVPFTFVDMAGLRDGSSDHIEVIGIERAAKEIARADLVLWLGPQTKLPQGAWDVAAQCDRPEVGTKVNADYYVSAVSGAGMRELSQALVDHARKSMPVTGVAAINARQRSLITAAHASLTDIKTHVDPLIVGECLRRARVAFDAITGRVSTEDVLDTLFGRFCIGK